mmetsp:Transcript_28016/g.44065  ORF Transcript_28016/g.44065 Transcript_28016/m.44065 type:complete len:685 (+) Transcript_28016:193-2247(+)
MEELQDAIEDAQYVNAISSVEDGPRPVLPWEIPTEEQLEPWKEAKTKAGGLEFEWTLSYPLGFFLFSAYLKEECEDYVLINFMEEVARWKTTQGRFRAKKTSFIASNYLLSPKIVDVKDNSASAQTHATSEESTTTAGEGEAAPEAATPEVHAPKFEVPPKTEISEYDLCREPVELSAEERKELCGKNTDPTKNCIAVGGEVLQTILAKMDKLRNAPGYDSMPPFSCHGVMGGDYDGNSSSDENPSSDSSAKSTERTRMLSLISNDLPQNLFDSAEVIVAEQVREKHWAGFEGSEYYTKMLNFLWFQDKKVVEEDFFVMRVLGRGGFGLVTACKKGTSGKLYAMKVMNKKRIKIKKAEKLTLNEQKCLADVDSPFVVKLSYSFQSKTDVFLILDLMTGGDLSFHLSMKGRFPMKECLYYGARIMLGLQALHDRGYVYRDLKPENCLLGEDGRVKLTDLGLATKVTPTLSGAAGTRGYWAPEMLKRDKNGKRMTYDQMVDWFSFGCCLAEFISGTNPFRSEPALNFGLGKGKKSKEKAIDYATLEMTPQFDSSIFSKDAADICLRLLDKTPKTRLGANGCKEIMSHPWFGDVKWESIISDRERPPFIPPKDVNAAAQSEIGTFAEDKTFHETVLDEKDEAVYKNWDFTSTKAFEAEVLEFLIYERETGEPLLPITVNTSCCCTVL